jgi:recombination protein RecA
MAAAASAIQELLLSRRVQRASALAEARPAAAAARLRLADLAGRVVQISGAADSAALTAAAGLVLEAQRAAEPVAWIARGAPFFPPDLDEAGVDLEALAVVLAPGPIAPALRAADHLLRAGAFGLLVLDLGAAHGLPLPAQTRLAGLAQRHASALLCLTEAARSLGSLVSLHLVARRLRLGDGRFGVLLRAAKDKRRGPGWSALEVCRGPAGLR